MQLSPSLSSLSSTTSSNSSTYGSRTILDAKDLPFAAPRCRSSIIAFVDNDETLFSPPSSPPPLPPPRRRQTQLPTSTLINSKSMMKCRHLFRTCLSSIGSPLSSLPSSSYESKLSNSNMQKEYFAKLCEHYRLLLVLTDYECKCGCHFSMRQGSFVILYETQNDFRSGKRSGLVTVITNELICSKIPSEYVCDVEILRERVRSRLYCNDDEQSFDL